MSTTIPDFWRTAWDAAQPRLDTLRQSPAGSPVPRPLRVGQLDSEQLDNELLVILKEPLTKGLDLLKVSLLADCPIYNILQLPSQHGESIMNLNYHWY
jgi:peroxin-2